MDNKEEYHDPDYPEAAVVVKEEPPSLDEEEKVDKIKEIIRREFLNELEIRENEVMLIDQRMTTSRRLLHRLRYALVSSYYKDQKLKLTNGQIQDEIAAQHEPRARAEVSTILRDGQRRLHPSVRKLLGKQSVDLDEIFKIREPRNKTRKDYSAMLQKRNYTISADTTKTLRPDRKPEDLELPEVCEDPGTSRPKKIPRQIDPKATNVVTLDEVTRNKMKYRYRIVIGNTSKYAPPASRADRSTHKWLLYVRGPPGAPDLAPLVTAVTVRLHHSYAPHHTVHIDKPPYHVSRRGWGEFPAKIELHFALPHRNRPATVEHTIKLDRNYTGMQILGAETLVDVWLYSTQEMLQYEYKDDAEVEPQPEVPIETHIKTEPEPTEFTEQPDTDIHTENWMDFFTKAPQELDVDEMIIKPMKKTEEIKQENVEIQENNTLESQEISYDGVVKTWDDNIDIPNEILTQPTSPKKRIVKYIDPTTGKIYYLEMDRTLDLSKVQEIVINNQTAKISPIKSNGLRNFRKKKGGMSLLKPEVKNMLKNSDCFQSACVSHIENDHCYIANPRKFASDVKKEKTLFDSVCVGVVRTCTVRAAVNYLLKKIPLISDQARDPDFVKHFPFVVETEERYWKLDFAKRRNIEWSRAKLINKLITDHLPTTETIWRTKQILLYSRLHGYYPIRGEAVPQHIDNNDWSSWNDLENIRKMETSIKELYPTSTDINSLTIFKNECENLSETIDLSDEEDVDVLSMDRRVQVKQEVVDSSHLSVLPVEGDEDRLRFLFVEKKCADIGIELRNEDVGNGYSYSAVHAVMLSAVRSFAEELIRGALAVKLTHDSGPTTLWAGSSRVVVQAAHVYSAARVRPRLRLLTAADTGARRGDTAPL
ncbi:YEATS domain containing 2 homolog D12 [Anticarsia gemmatalis]|uniref:YEATS domain containing 2 homolog D12 n=1 Tax=Anticarsia gemmatalis TaxID=129554 RepID=UPI003F7621D4